MKTWKRIWHFLWREDSAASWIVNVILAFVIIKFILYPALGFVLGTSFPIVAVVSESMEHDITREYRMTSEGKVYTDNYVMCGNKYEESKRVSFNVFWEECGGWYEGKSISQQQFKDFSLHNGFNKGDIMILRSAKDVEVGDVIVFWASRPEPIIHRVVAVEEGKYLTKGDHNSKEDGFVSQDKVIGKALLRVPFLGWVKVWFVSFIQLFV